MSPVARPAHQQNRVSISCLPVALAQNIHIRKCAGHSESALRTEGGSPTRLTNSAASLVRVACHYGTHWNAFYNTFTSGILLRNRLVRCRSLHSVHSLNRTIEERALDQLNGRCPYSPLGFGVGTTRYSFYISWDQPDIIRDFERFIKDFRTLAL